MTCKIRKYYLDLSSSSLRRLDEQNSFCLVSCKATTFIQRKQVRFANISSSVKVHLKILSALWTSRNSICALRNWEISTLRMVEIFPYLFESWKLLLVKILELLLLLLC